VARVDGDRAGFTCEQATATAATASVTTAAPLVTFHARTAS
jgi:hypothetical protein